MSNYSDISLGEPVIFNKMMMSVLY